LWRSLAEPLTDFNNQLSKANRDRDLTQVFSSSSDDELGYILQEQGKLFAILRGCFNSINSEVKSLIHRLDEVDTSARNISRNSQLQSDASQHMNQSVDDMVHGIASISSESEEARSHTRNTLEVAEAGTVDIRNTVDSIQAISQSVVNASTSISALKEDCNSISDMAVVIHQIAD